MAYTIQVDWAGKNALGDAETAKIISGDDFDEEFTEIQTVFLEKAEKVGSGAQAFATSTAAATSNTTVSASTEYVTRAVSNLALGTASTQGYFVSATEPTVTLESGDVWYQT